MTFPTEWDYKVKLTSDNTKVASAVKGLAVDLSNMPAGFWTNVKSDGSDIRITSDEEGTTQVARDVISIDTTGETGLIRFDTSSISTGSDTDYWLFYGNSEAAEPSPSDTYGQYNTYDSDLKAYITPTGSGSTVFDRTSNQNHCEIQGGLTIGDGKIDKAFYFNGTNSFLSYQFHNGTNNLFNIGQQFTISQWIYIPSYSSNWHAIYLQSSASSVASRNQGIGVRVATTGKLVTFAGKQNLGDSRSVESVSDVPINTWVRVTGKMDNTILQVALNGVVDETNSTDSGNVVFGANCYSPTNTYIGARAQSQVSGVCQSPPYTNVDFFQSRLQEQFVWNRYLTEDEDLTFYNNESDNDSFWTFGPQEEVTGITIATLPASNITFNSAQLNCEIEGVEE